MNFKDRLFLWLSPYPEWGWYIFSSGGCMLIGLLWYYASPDLTGLFHLLEVSPLATQDFTFVNRLEGAHGYSHALQGGYSFGRSAQPRVEIADVIVESGRNAGVHIEYLRQSHLDGSSTVDSVEYGALGAIEKLLEAVRLCADSREVCISEVRISRVDQSSGALLRLEMVATSVPILSEQKKSA